MQCYCEFEHLLSQEDLFFFADRDLLDLSTKLNSLAAGRPPSVRVTAVRILALHARNDTDNCMDR